MSHAPRSRHALLAPLLVAALGAGCSTSPPTVQTWGTMREVLREGDSRGRIEITRAIGPNSIAVGALAGLEGEVTVVDGRAMVAVGSTGEVRTARPGDEAALFVLANVPGWRPVALGERTLDLDALERVIADALTREGFDLEMPVPIRVRGFARTISCHVIAGACPIANPDGPAPRRLEQRDVEVELVGVFADGRAGELTHHTNRSHLHVLAHEMMGHLDAVEISQAVLLVPARH